MKISKISVVVLSLLILLSSCASTTLIQSNPPGAKIYIDGQMKGTTPYTLTDTKISFDKTQLKLELENYQTLNTTLTKSEEVNVGAVVGGFFLLMPFLWTMQYSDSHLYDLQPNQINGEIPAKAPVPVVTPNTEPNKNSITIKAEKLRELKKILDEGLITKEEYEKEKKKILDEK